MTRKKATEKEKEALEKYLLQFLNIEKQFPLLPGVQNIDAVAGLMGLETEELLKLRSLYEENARQAAAELLKEENIFDWTDELPFQPGDTIVALGSSTTDDLQGWFTILKHVLDIALDDPDFKFINAGMPNNTTTDALRRINRELLSHEPDWVFVDLGLFDAQRLSYTPSKTLIPLSETWENLTIIDDVIETVTENPPNMDRACTHYSRLAG